MNTSNTPIDFPEEQRGMVSLSQYKDIQSEDFDRRSVLHASLQGKITNAMSMLQEAANLSQLARATSGSSSQAYTTRYLKVEAIYASLAEAISTLQMGQIACRRLGSFKPLSNDGNFFDSVNKINNSSSVNVV